jgi:NADH:ubiquinone oxidoreductase subunit E
MKDIMNVEEIKNILKKFKTERSYILNALHAIQNANPYKYLSEEALIEVAKHFNLTKAQVFGVVTYYSMFSYKPRAKYIIRVCKSPVCYMKNSMNLINYLQELVSKDNSNTFIVENSECLGLCNKAPAMMINEEIYTDLTVEKVNQIIEFYKSKSL